MTSIHGKYLFEKFVHRLYPNKSTKVTPSLDRTAFLSSSKSCLLLRRDKNNFFGRAKTWVWWYIWVMFFLLAIFLSYFFVATEKDLLRNNWLPDVFFYGSLWLGVLPFLISWRLDLPICFNRETRKVSCWVKGSLAEVAWDKTGDNARTFRSVNAYGSTLIEQSIGFEMYINTFNKHNTKYNLIIPLTVFSDKDSVEIAKGLWEYIRVFMDEGKEALPQTNKSKLHSLKEIWATYNYFPVRKHTLFSNLVRVLIFPLSLAFACICIPTEIIYRILNVVLPRRKMPEPLRKAYEAV